MTDPSLAPFPQDSNRLTSVVGDAMAMQLPLPVALRTAAADPSSRTLRSRFLALAERLDRGESLSAAVAAMQGAFPAIVEEVFRADPAAARHAFVRLQLQRRRSAERRRNIRMDLMSPVALLVGTFVLMLFVTLWIVPQFQAIFDSFGTRVPGITSLFVSVSQFLQDHWFAVTACLVSVTSAGFGVFAASRRVPSLRLVVYQVPWLGRAIRQSAQAEFCEFLSLLTDMRLPLDRALPIAADASGDAVLRQAAAEMAALLRSGQTPDGAAEAAPMMPSALAHCFRYATSPESLASILQARAVMLNATAESQSAIAPLIMKPVAITLAAMFIGVTVMAIFAPLVDLLDALS